MKSSTLLFLLAGLTVLSGCTPTSSTSEQVESSIPSSNSMITDPEYYGVWSPTKHYNFTLSPSYEGNFWSTIDFNKSGETLKKDIETYMKSKFVGVTYSGALAAVKEMDRDPANTQNILSIYDLKSQPINNYPLYWNREHAFPQSKLADGNTSLRASDSYANLSSDVANIFASDSDLNTARSNNSFGEFNFESDPETYLNFVQKNTDGDLTDSLLRRGYWSPTPLVRGEIARSQLYMLLMYPDNCSLTENFQIETMLKWDIEWPPTDERDGQRQKGIEKYQKVRNPFIDNRELGCKIWGETNNFTKNVCNI